MAADFDMFLGTLVEALSSPAVLVPFILISLSTFYSFTKATNRLPATIPWVGKKSGRAFAETRAHFSSFVKVKQWLNEGYEKYSRRGQIYALPDFSGKPEVIIPSSEIRWLLDQPEKVLSASELHYDSLGGPYLFTHPRILKEPFHEQVVHRYLGRRVGELVMDLWDEVGSALDETWGTNTEEWKETCVYDNMMHVLARASNRIFVGLPLCRNKAYLKSMESFAGDVGLSLLAMRFIPKTLEPILGRLIGLPNNYHYRNSAALHLPLVKERLANIEKKAADPSFEWNEPSDYLTWHIRLAQREGNTTELQPEMISRRLMPLNFAAIHTTVFTATNCFFDLLSSSSIEAGLPPIETIREEVVSTFEENDGIWTKGALSHLFYTDSAIRESMRASGFLTRGLQRKVVAKEGLEHKDFGWKLPFGSTVSVDAYGIMHDEANYARAQAFDPFRFARQREREDALSASSGKQSSSTLESKRLSCSSTSETFLAFGHGRHACPGRFLVSHELKLLLAYASMYYEFEPLETRPSNSWFGQHILPPTKAKIRVRRRKPGNMGF